MSFHRRPRTTRERRDSLYAEGYCRAKRNFHNLPEAWDDITRTKQRSWKEHRKHQYKVRKSEN
jgi:hypothetical protein